MLHTGDYQTRNTDYHSILHFSYPNKVGIALDNFNKQYDEHNPQAEIDCRIKNHIFFIIIIIFFFWLTYRQRRTSLKLVAHHKAWRTTIIIVNQIPKGN